MLHAKFQDHRTSGSGEEDFLKVFTIYGRGGHLGHVTWTIYTNIGSPFPRRLHIKGPGLIRGIFGLRFSTKVKFAVLFGLYSHHKGNMP